VLNGSWTFAAGQSAPDTLYGTVPMAFSEFFHDITAEELAPDATVFNSGWENADVAEPEKFITQGTRTGNQGTITYADGDKLEKVDVVSSATFGDASVHFVPNGNHIVTGDRNIQGEGSASIEGIQKVEVGVRFDLYANAVLLENAGRRTAQSINVLSKMEGFAPEEDLYSVKYMLADGNWGARTILNDDATYLKDLPGTNHDEDGTEGLTYGNQWGDYVTGFVFGPPLEDEYAGNNYFDNFAEYIYGGYVEDEQGNKEPLVFLQNIFTHKAHTDFDIALSPSRFARFGNLEYPGTYNVTIFVYGFPDVEFEFEIEKTLINPSAAISGATSFDVSGTTPITFTVTGITDATGYKIYKGTVEIDADNYTITHSGNTATVTLGSAFLDGLYWGNYTISREATEDYAYKALSFTLVNSVAVKLGLNQSGNDWTECYTSETAIEVSADVGALYFSDTDFASAININARGGSTIKVGDAAAAAIGAAVTRGSNDDPYYIDLTAAIFEAGKTYTLTIIATGFKTHTFYITITDTE
jgi:hypothetical protein